MGIFYDKTKHLAFNEALVLLIEEYQQRKVGTDIMTDDLFNAAEEMLRKERQQDEYDAMHGPR